MSVSKFHYIYLIVFYIPLHTKTVFYQNDSETLATGVLHVSLRGLSQRSSSKSPPREGGNIANRSWKMSDAPLRGKEADTDMPDATRRGQQKSNNTHSRNSSTSSDKEAELLSQAAWAHMKDKMEDPDFLEKLASSVAETATQTATASATKAATLAATASATKAATDSATKAASVAATTDAIEQASAALRNLVNSTEFKENLSRSSGEIATNAAANYMAAQIQSEPFQMKVAEMAAKHHTVGSSAADTANKVIREFLASENLFKTLSSQEGFTQAFDLHVQEAFQKLHDKVAASAENATHPPDRELLKTLLKKSKEISDLKVSFESIKSQLDDVNIRLVEGDENDNAEKETLTKIMDDLYDRIEANSQKTNEIDSLKTLLDGLKVDSKFCFLYTHLTHFGNNRPSCLLSFPCRC